MAYYRINGGNRLEGAVTISGAKNAALAIIPAVILSGESCLLENLPEIEDVRIVEEILTSMGADISRTPDGSMRIDPSGISTFSVTGEMVSSMRASYYLLGARLGRDKKAEIALPGGCAIGQRPIDQHIKGMRALGAEIVIQGGSVKARADRRRGAEIYLDVVSVGATINIMLAAVAAVLQFVEFSIPIMPAFVKLDISDLPALLGAFALGPVYGVVISFMKNLLHIVVKGTSTACVGELCNFMLGAVFSAVAGVIYKHHKSRKTAILGAVAGAAAMAVFSVPSNYFITYPAYVEFYHMPLEAILGMYQAILPSADSLMKCLVIFNLPFTLVKGLLDAVLCMVIYKPLSPILHGRK